MTAKTGFFQTVPNDQPPSYQFLAANNSSFSNTRAGWTVGGGASGDFVNWSVKLEYLYYDRATRIIPSASRPTGFGDILLVSNTRASTRFDGHVARLGVNYHFDWAAPSAIARDFLGRIWDFSTDMGTPAIILLTWREGVGDKTVTIGRRNVSSSLMNEITSVPIEVVSIGVDVMRWFESEEFSEWYESFPIAEPCEMVLARVL